jgi:hypothetical protein
MRDPEPQKYYLSQTNIFDRFFSSIFPPFFSPFSILHLVNISWAPATVSGGHNREEGLPLVLWRMLTGGVLAIFCAPLWHLEAEEGGTV